MRRAVRSLSRVVAATLALALVAWAPAGAAQEAPDTSRSGPPFVVHASIEPSVGTIGDRLHYRLILDRRDDVNVVIPDIVADLAPFEVLDATLSEPEERDGRVVESRDYIVAVFETGELFVPPLEFAYVTAEGDSGTGSSDSLLVTIETVLPEVREDQQVGPMDIKPPVELPRRIWPIILVALAVVAAAVGFYFLRKWLSRRQAGREEDDDVVEPVVPRIAAHVVALERLDSLERDDLIGRGEIPRFYVRVTEIVRLYLRDRFGVDAIDMTTSELTPAMREARMDDTDIEWSESYMVHADLAKFAKHVPDEERARADMSEARLFVERTRLRGEQIVEGDAGRTADGPAGAAESGPDDRAEGEPADGAEGGEVEA